MSTATSVRDRNEKPNWSPCPINPSWILEGAPVARIECLSTSDDGTASTFFWDCTAGRFNWFYTFDETLHILEGSFSLKDPDGTTWRVNAGDVVYFRKGASAEWTVDSYVRKLAFCRTALPGYLVTARDAARRVLKVVRGGKVATAGGMFPT